MAAKFRVMLRGYDMDQVDELLARADQASASADLQLRATVREELQTAHFRDRLHGYSRPQVDWRVEQLIWELGTDSEPGPEWF